MRIVEKPATVRDLCAVDPSAIVERLVRVSEKVWDRADAEKENKFFCFDHTRHIVHRFIPSNQDPRESYETMAWFAWRDFLQPLMDEIAEVYGYEQAAFPKAMFARLAAGQVIDRHVDGAGSNLVTHKIHVPLVTNPQAVFSVDDHEVHIPYGRAVEVNNIRPHAARNDGAEDRIHFIFELYDAAQPELASA